MKRIIFTALACLLLPIAGCHPAANTTQPPAALAPGYSSAADQTLGQSLAALNAFVLSEKGNYQCDATAKSAGTCLTPAQQATEKPYLNSLIDAVTVANAAYTGFHQGTGTINQAQAAVSQAQSAQSVLTQSKGVK